MKDVAEETNLYREILKNESRTDYQYFTILNACAKSNEAYDTGRSRYVYFKAFVNSEIQTNTGLIVPGTRFNMTLCKGKPDHLLIAETGVLGFISYDPGRSDYSFSTMLYLSDDTFDEIFDDTKRGITPSRASLSFVARQADKEHYGFQFIWDTKSDRYGLVTSIGFEYGESRNRFQGAE